MQAWVQAAYTRQAWLWPLYPLGWLFQGVVRLRRWAYQQGWCQVRTFAVPVVVVGNITLGGTGKTPLIIWLADFLRKQGYRPGIVSRGYGADIQAPILLTDAHRPEQVGDEACLLFKQTGCPTVVCPRRVEAVRLLREQTDINIVLSDDGLQHYALGRVFEIALIDASRGLGNGQCLPAGPLREPPSRLKSVDAVVWHGKSDAPLSLSLVPTTVDNGCGQSTPLSHWKGKSVHACAGIGHPERFFDMLRAHGINVIPHPFADHHAYTPSDLDFGDELPIFMTAKDAIKCQGLSKTPVWTVQVESKVTDRLGYQLIEKLGAGHAAR